MNICRMECDDLCDYGGCDVDHRSGPTCNECLAATEIPQECPFKLEIVLIEDGPSAYNRLEAHDARQEDMPTLHQRQPQGR